ncbi:NAD-dependent protein deacylase [Myxococcota bacterium]
MIEISGEQEAQTALEDWLAHAKRLVALTGAGASAASGVPTYRGAGGAWTRYDPNRYASISYFRHDPSYYWCFFRDERYPSLKKAGPNPVHVALAELESSGKLSAVVTQNIDGLHQAGGSERVFELHGNSRRFVCEACQATHDFEKVRSLIDDALPPVCPGCGQAQLRPDVVLFGEPLPHDTLTQAMREMRRADRVLVVGSSLVVQPAAALPLMTLEQGGELAIMNIDPTPLDSDATLVIRAPADRVLPAAIGP